ncbi:rhoGEF domain-containing protein gxcI-like isoform X2 [Scylla paramamosain]|uniref:rhoGEF domain-containing protein gxcI-like isoform X2 n=1 Tax=Scylla paramamosain TaxID=85552 RepID=UPI003082995F
MVRVSWGGEVVIADLAHVGEDGGNGGEGGHSLPTNGIPTSTTPQALTPTASATPSETPTISPAPTVSTPPTVSPPPRAPTAMVEGLSDGDESAVSTSFSDDHRSLRDDLRDDFSSPRPRSPRRRLEKRPLSKVTEDDNNNGNGDGNGNGDKSAKGDERNGDVTLSSDEYRRFLTLKGSPPDSQKPPSPRLRPPMTRSSPRWTACWPPSATWRTISSPSTAWIPRATPTATRPRPGGNCSPTGGGSFSTSLTWRGLARFRGQTSETPWSTQSSWRQWTCTSGSSWQPSLLRQPPPPSPSRTSSMW